MQRTEDEREGRRHVGHDGLHGLAHGLVPRALRRGVARPREPRLQRDVEPDVPREGLGAVGGARREAVVRVEDDGDVADLAEVHLGQEGLGVVEAAAVDPEHVLAGVLGVVRVGARAAHDVDHLGGVGRRRGRRT